ARRDVRRQHRSALVMADAVRAERHRADGELLHALRRPLYTAERDAVAGPTIKAAAYNPGVGHGGIVDNAANSEQASTNGNETEQARRVRTFAERMFARLAPD